VKPSPADALKRRGLPSTVDQRGRLSACQAPAALRCAALGVISQPQSTGEWCANSMFPALIRVLINFAHSGISSDGAGTMRECPLISLCPRNYALSSPAECAEPEVPLRCDSYEGWHSRRRRAGSPWPTTARPDFNLLQNFRSAPSHARSGF
jgi:hypothetical protein